MPSGVYKRTKPVWNKGLTKETDERVAKYIDNGRKTLNEKYGVNSPSKTPSAIKQRIEHKTEIYEKVANTKLNRYGSKTYNNIEKAKQTKLEKYGDENYNNSIKNANTRIENNNGVYWSDEQKSKLSNSRINNKSQEKAKETIIKKYGDLKTYYEIVNKKIYETMLKNGTFKQKETQPEKEYYNMLLEKYSSDQIIKQYRDPIRYPFKCDFYIIPEDKFIEIHAFFTHGPHPFDSENDYDVELLNKLKELNTPWAKNFIYTWTDLDVRKLKTALENNLNFEAIYWYNS